MKLKAIAFVIAITCFTLNSYAQKSISNNSKQPIVSEQERKLSVYFADGVKEFYAENFQLAEEKFRYVIANNPNHATAYYMLGKIYKEKKEYSSAENYLQKAISIEKKNVWFIIELAHILDLQENYQQSIKYWAKVCELKPESEYYIYYYSQACIMTQNYKEVLKSYTKLEKLVGHNDEITRAKVEIWLFLNDVKNAVKEYDMLITEDPSNENYYLQAANLYIINNMQEKALPYFSKVMEINPDNAEIQLTMADYYNKIGEQEAAYNAYVKVFESPQITIDRKLPILRTFLLKLPTSMPSPQQYELSRILTKVHPDAVEGWAAMGSLCLKEKNYEQAAYFFEKAIHIEIAQYALWEDYLYTLSQIKDYQRIIDNEKDINELFPTNSMMAYTLGVAYLNSNNPEKALNYLEKALKNSFDNGEKSRIYKMMANAYHELGNETKAQEYLEKGK